MIANLSELIGNTTNSLQRDRLSLLGKVRGREEDLRSPYESIFRRAGEEEGIKFEGVGNMEKQAYSTTSDLAARFIDEFIRKTGELPDEEQVTNFLGSTIDAGYAVKSFTGELPPQTVQSQFVVPAVNTLVSDREEGRKSELQRFADEKGQSDFEQLSRQTIAERRGLSDVIAQLQIEEGTKSLEQQF